MANNLAIFDGPFVISCMLAVCVDDFSYKKNDEINMNIGSAYDASKHTQTTVT